MNTIKQSYVITNCDYHLNVKFPRISIINEGVINLTKICMGTKSKVIFLLIYPLCDITGLILFSY